MIKMQDFTFERSIVNFSDSQYIYPKETRLR